MKYESTKIEKLVSSFKQAVSRLEQLSKLSYASFANDPDKLGSAKYHFIVAIEAAIDICNHLIAKNNLRVPEDYADTFRVMGEAGIFEPKFINSLINMAKFRNRLVHLYWDVDDKILYKILQENLGDLNKYLRSIAKVLCKQ